MHVSAKETVRFYTPVARSLFPVYRQKRRLYSSSENSSEEVDPHNLRPTPTAMPHLAA